MKEKTITRTITTINAIVVLANLDTRAFSEAPVTIADCKDDSILDAIRALIETEAVKVLTIKSFEREKHLYALSESDFISFGKVIK